MPRFIVAITLGCLLFGLSGCGAQIPQEELGTVEFRVPQFPGAEEPYPLDQLKEREAVD